MMAKRVRLTVSGDVQGVGFRAHTHGTARGLGVRGYVRNLPTGEVEIVAEGDDGPIDRLIEWVRRGPPLAQVDDVQVEEGDPTGEFQRFEIRH